MALSAWRFKRARPLSPPLSSQPESHATGEDLLFPPHRLGLHFLPPIVPAPGETADALRQRVFEVMWDYYTGNA